MSPAAASPTSEPASQDVRVKPGQTLYQISVAKLGKYDKNVLQELQNLNPGSTIPTAYIPDKRFASRQQPKFPQKHRERRSRLLMLHPQRQENNEQKL